MCHDDKVGEDVSEGEAAMYQREVVTQVPSHPHSCMMLLWELRMCSSMPEHLQHSGVG